MHPLVLPTCQSNRTVINTFLCLVFILLSSCGKKPDSIPGALKQHDHSLHQHAMLEVKSFGANTAIPHIDFSIEADSASGWNIHIKTDNFRFSPEQINAAAVSNEGHAHLFVDDFKIARIYSHWYHLKKLTPGEHTVRVSLNANDHSEWAHQGEVLAKSKKIIQQTN